MQGKASWRRVVVLFSLLAGAVLVLVERPSPAMADPVCQSGGVYVLWARGSGQPLNDGEAVQFRNNVFGALSAAGISRYDWAELGNLDGNFNVNGVEYPAVPVNDYHVLPWIYGDSVRKGTDELVKHLNDRYAGNGPTNSGSCGNEVVVLGGYSQGADVIGWALERTGGDNTWSLSPAARQHIAYVALYGDPRFNSWCPAPQWVRGNARCDTVGILEMRDPYLPPDVVDRVGSWCDQYDGICNFRTVFPGTHGETYEVYWIWQSAAEIANSAKRRVREFNPGPNRPSGGGIATSRGVQRLDVIIEGTNLYGNNTYRNSVNYSPWGGWNPMENSNSSHIASQPATVSWNSNRIDAFARGGAGDLLHRWYNTTTGWGDWVSMGSCLLGAPTVSSWGPDRLDVFARACNTSGLDLLHWWWDSSHIWHSENVPDSSGIRLGDSPSATSWGVGRIDIFARGENGNEYHKWYDASVGWLNWAQQAGCVSGQPAVASWAQFRLDVFVKDCGGSLWHNWYDGTSWYWEPLQGGNNYTVANFMGAVSWGSGRIDLFALSSGSEPIHKFYDGGWSTWENLEGWAAGP